MAPVVVRSSNAPLNERVNETMDARHLGRRDQEIPVFGADPEPVAPSQELLLRYCFATGIVHADIVHVHAALILAVEAPT